MESPNMRMCLGIEHAKRAQQPQYHYNDDDNIQDALDFPIHGKICVNKPQQDADYDEYNKDRE
jgi:hypothetical protein